VAKRAEETLKGFFTPGMLFEAFGFEYFGPIDGHNQEQLIETFEKVRHFDDAVLIHVLTKKGKGYAPAEKNPALFHGVGPFDIATGKILKSKGGAASYTGVFGDALVKLAADDERIVAITAAMPDGTGLTKFAREYPERFFDVGIAEQHGVTFAAGLAAEGLRPVFAVYSSFLQRAYDQVIHDICLMQLPVTFAIDRAGVVGNDGPTHHGLFDLSYLRAVPNMIIMAPKDENELQHMLCTAVESASPVAIRYPRGSGHGVPLDQQFRHLELGKGEQLRPGADGAVFAVGSLVYPALQAAEILSAEGIELTVVNARFVKPLDRELIVSLALATGRIITCEENALQGGFGTAVLEVLEQEGVCGVNMVRIGYPDTFIEQGEQSQLHARYGLDCTGLAARFRTVCRGM
jgi:1-deoxy-D-xylulose-5-phosphate synthase